MEIYELKDGCQLKQIQKIYKLEIFGQVVEDISYDTKIITDGFIDSNNDISEIYDYYSKNDIVRTANLYLKNYTYAIVLTIGRESFYNGKVGGVINRIKNITLYLRNLNDKEALKTAKEVIKCIKQANSECEDFSMNPLLQEENNDFLFDVLDKNIYSVRKQIDKKKKYRLDNLYVVWNKNDKDINYLLCTYNHLQNYYIEVLTNTVIRPDSNIEENYLPLILGELNIKINMHKKLNYYELIYLYNKIRNISVPNLEDKHNVIDSGKKVMVKK